jgi:proteasome lid subunit RPN8/RPN11
MIEEIKEHFEKEYPREGCGIIGIVKGEKKWFPCTNIATDDNDFVLSTKEWINVKRQADIFAVVHSHIEQSNEPSSTDVNACNAVGVPYWIFTYPTMELNIVEPAKRFEPLIGREYEFGVTDCFEATRDWLATKDIDIPPRAPFFNEWWDKGEDYFTEDNIKNWNHVKVEIPKPNDVLIFNVKSNIANHCGVYLGNDIFYHHAVNRLSCRESLYPWWGQYLTGIYRHET